MPDQRDELGVRRDLHLAEREVERLRRFLTRIASPDEITGDGPVELMVYGPEARELKARMRMARRGVDGEQYP